MRNEWEKYKGARLHAQHVYVKAKLVLNERSRTVLTNAINSVHQGRITPSPFYQLFQYSAFSVLIRQAFYELVLSFSFNSISHNHSTTITDAGNIIFHPTEHGYAKKTKNCKI